jgi:hypothetical protein
MIAAAAAAQDATNRQSRLSVATNPLHGIELISFRHYGDTTSRLRTDDIRRLLAQPVPR